MKVKSLISKLQKMAIDFVVIDHNGHNQEVEFKINGKSYSAKYDTKHYKVYAYSQDVCYNDCSQETSRNFFYNFNQVMLDAAR